VSGTYLRGRIKRLEVADAFNAEAFSFDIEIANDAKRSVQILGHDLQLWQSPQSGSKSFFVASLLLNQQKEFVVALGPGEKREYVFCWHQTDEQLQQIEDRRKDGPPGLQLRARFLTRSNWAPDRQSDLDWEMMCGADPVCWPMSEIVTLDDWMRLLDKIGFQSTIAPRISVPPLPPAFRRSAEILHDAWSQHFSGNKSGALASSRMAIECLPFNLFETQGELNTLVGRILVNTPQEKVKAVNGLILAVRDLRNLACHERGEPVALQPSDSELALTCTAAILKYLAVHVQK
jgi:hypothetical protein